MWTIWPISNGFIPVIRPCHDPRVQVRTPIDVVDVVGDVVTGSKGGSSNAKSELG